MIPAEAVEAAAKGMYALSYDIRDWDIATNQLKACYLKDARSALESAAPHMLAGVADLIRALTDAENCSFDHHGGCQAHGYLDLQPGEKCPQAEAKEWSK